MFNWLLNYRFVPHNITANQQKSSSLQNKSPGFMATEAGLYLATGIILIALTSKIMHQQIIYMHKLFQDQFTKYQIINLIAELQQDLLLPAKIIPNNSQERSGFKIIRKNKNTIDWQFKPNVQRGIKGSWTKLYKGQIEYKFEKHRLLIDIKY